MKTKNHVLLLLSLFLWVISGFSQSSEIEYDAACYHNESVLLMKAPKNWSPDYSSLADQGICVVYVPAAQTFYSSSSVIYPNTSQLEPNDHLDQFITKELSRFEKATKNIQITKKPDVAIGSLTFKIREIKNGPAPNEFEQIAYGAVGSSVFIFVQSSRGQASFNVSVSSFQEALKNIKIETRSEFYKRMDKLALEDSATPKGKEYKNKANKTFASSIANVIKSCEVRDSHKAMVSIDSTGTVRDVFFEKIPKAEACAKRIMYATRLPTPPDGAFRLGVIINTSPK